MKSSAFYAIIGIGVLIVAGIIWWSTLHTHKTASAPAAQTRTTSIAQVATSSVGTLSIYTNGTYGFSILYPGSFPIQTNFPANSPTVVQIGTPERGVIVTVHSDTSTCEKTKIKEGKCFDVRAVGISTHDATLDSIVNSFTFAPS